jgi:hypothetical protein
MERLIAKMDGRRRILMIGAVSLWLELVLPRDARVGRFAAYPAAGYTCSFS